MSAGCSCVCAHRRELYRRTCEALPTPLTDTFRLSAAAAFRCFGDVLTSAALGQLLLACGVQNSEAVRFCGPLCHVTLQVQCLSNCKRSCVSVSPSLFSGAWGTA